MKRAKQKKNFGFFILVIVSFLLTISSLAFSEDFEYSAPVFETDVIQMIVGDLETVWAKDLTRIAITNSSVADAVETTSSEILMSAKRPGKTDVFIWDKYGKRSVRIWVFEEDLDLVKSRLEALLVSADFKYIKLEKNEFEGKLIATGELDSNELKEKFDNIIEPFLESVVNFVKVKIHTELIQLDVQVAEINSTYTKNLGLDWTNATGGGSLEWDEELPTFNPSAPTDFLKVGDFTRTTALQATINALITEGKGKILSKPKIVAKSGEEANFLVGGQIPVRSTTTSSGGNVSENVEFKDYGVELNIKATAKENGKIDVELKVDITDVDTSYAVSGNYAYTTRSAETKLLLDDGQSVILAGFIKKTKTETIKRIPFLSDIPILGAVFRNRNLDPNQETELFITLTPRIISEKKEKIPEIVLEKEDASVNISEKISMAILQKPIKTAKETFRGISVPADMADYIRAMQKKIAKNLVYPDAAKASDQQGNVDLDLLLLQNGALLSSSIRESSGYPDLDEAALQTVQRLSPYGDFPLNVNAREITITLPVVYRLDIN